MSRPQDETFAEWIADHYGIVVKIVRSFTTVPADAEDLTQEISLSLWRSIPKFHGQAKTSTWIWRVALNRALSWQRRVQDQPTSIDAIAEPEAASRADSGALVNRIYDAIHALAPIDRSLIVLALEGYRYAEIAEITGLTETNVGARLSRARSHLTNQLEDTQ